MDPRVLLAWLAVTLLWYRYSAPNHTLQQQQDAVISASVSPCGRDAEQLLLSSFQQAQPGITLSHTITGVMDPHPNHNRYFDPTPNPGLTASPTPTATPTPTPTATLVSVPSVDPTVGGATSTSTSLSTPISISISTPLISIAEIRESLRSRWIVLMGDSVVRQTYTHLVRILQRKPFSASGATPGSDKAKHSDQEVRIGSTKVTFLWRPYLSNVSSTLPSLLLPPSGGAGAGSSSSSRHPWFPSPWTPPQPLRPHLIIVSSLLHDLLYNYTHLQTNVEILQHTLKNIVLQAHTKPYIPLPSLLFLSGSSILDACLTGHRLSAPQFRDQHVVTWNTQLSQFITQLATFTGSSNILMIQQYDITRAVQQQMRLEQSLNDSCRMSLSALSSTDVMGDSTWQQSTLSDGVHSSAASAVMANLILSTWTCSWRIGHVWKLTPSQWVLVIGSIILATAVCWAYLLQQWRTHNQTNRKLTNDSDLEMELGSLLPSRRHHVHESPSVEPEPEPEPNATSTPNENITPHVIAVSVLTGQTNDKQGLQAEDSVGRTSPPPSPSLARHKPFISIPHSVTTPGSFLLSSTHWPAIKASAMLATICITCYLLDGDYRVSWWVFGIMDKTYVRDSFYFVCAMILVCAVLTIRPTQDVILFRDQTEEWKGWMQIMFVLYHYFAAKELYNGIRVFIGAYVWMTGYGNYFFFMKTKDFSIGRLAKMLFRLNFLVCVMCIVMNREYMQYYVCALHTFYFLLVYGIMCVYYTHNPNPQWMLLKFGIAGILLILIFDIKQTGLFQLLFGGLDVLYLSGSLWEWEFRSTLDHFATLIGMVCAFHLNKFTYALNMFWSFRSSIRFVISVVCVWLSLVWIDSCLLLPKKQYNQQHPYTSWFPILMYILIRNIHSKVRSKVLWLFTWCGRITLESYILQFHLWLSDDAGTLLNFVPGYPLLNFVFASIGYILASKVAFDVTTILSDYIMPSGASSRDIMLRWLIIAATWFTALNIIHVVVGAGAGLPGSTP